jgi:hypothetical protein
MTSYYQITFVTSYLISFNAGDEDDGCREDAEGEGDGEGDDQIDFAFRFVEGSRASESTSESSETNGIGRSFFVEEQIRWHSI